MWIYDSMIHHLSTVKWYRSIVLLFFRGRLVVLTYTGVAPRSSTQSCFILEVPKAAIFWFFRSLLFTTIVSLAVQCRFLKFAFTCFSLSLHPFLLDLNCKLDSSHVDGVFWMNRCSSWLLYVKSGEIPWI
jgi:hypothetical protein